jgi:SAM-dependent methyltransferase
MTANASTTIRRPNIESWRHAIPNDSSWIWQNGKLYHAEALRNKPALRQISKIQTGFVASIYADQNRSRVVVRLLNEQLVRLKAGSIALNIGSGGTRYDNVTNLDIFDGPNVDIVGHGAVLPFSDRSVDLVITQEVLEHVADFQGLISEIHRVLRPGGVFFCQVPFQIGFHPGPSDYWRFTRQGLEHLFAGPHWQLQELRISLGHGSGFYRIAVEFLAVTFSCVAQPLYRPVKAGAALCLYPIKIFDLLTEYSAEKDRIPGGYVCTARRMD